MVAHEHLVVFSSCPNAQVAEHLARALVERKVAACVNIVPDVRSVYRWRGTVEIDTEQMLVIKCMKENYPLVEKCIVNLHPYDVPEVIAVPITTGARGYLDWLEERE